MNFAKRFIQKFALSIVCMLSCFDRVIFKARQQNLWVTRRWRQRRASGGSSAAPHLLPAPGTAPGLLPSRALSSAQADDDFSRRCGQEHLRTGGCCRRRIFARCLSSGGVHPRSISW